MAKPKKAPAAKPAPAPMNLIATSTPAGPPELCPQAPAPMNLIATSTIQHDGKTYVKDDLIENVAAHQAKSLIDLGAAELAE